MQTLDHSPPTPLHPGDGLGVHGADAETPPARRWTRWLVPAIAILVLALALQALHAELRGHTYHEISATVRAIPASQVRLALLFTVIAFLILPGYDALALAYVGQLRGGGGDGSGESGARRIPLWRAGFSAIIAYGVSQTVGFAALSGSAVRFRFWTAWGLSAPEIVRAAGFVSVTFTTGIVLVCGLALVLEPGSELTQLDLAPEVARVVGVALLAAVAAYVAWMLLARERGLRLPEFVTRWFPATRDWTFSAPRPALVAGQIVVPLLDWTAAALVLWVLLPADSRPPAAAVAGLFVVAQFAGLVSHVPAGAGIFDTLIVLGLRPFVPADAAISALLAYRAIYYLLPFATALALFAAYEAHQRSTVMRAATTAAVRSVAAVGSVTRTMSVPAAALGAALIPGALATAVFAGGCVLLLSGATPSIHGRVAALLRFMPIGVIEVSHLMASITGVLLLVLAWALWRRIRDAWGLAIVLLAFGAVASLLKGLDWEEALALTAVLATVLPFRRAFYRRSALTAEPFQAGWVLAILAVLGVTLAVGMFSYQHVPYDADLWWLVRPRADAPRFLRATLGSSLALAVLASVRLLGRARPVLAKVDESALDRVSRIVARSTDPTGHLALLGDKSLLFADPAAASDDVVDGFIQYGVVGRSWIAMGDPIVTDIDGDGSRRETIARVRSELAWRFKRDADLHDGRPVFYEVRRDLLPLYIDLGLTFLKVGEAAHVDLASFSMEGGSRKGLRRTVKEVERSGAVFSVASPDQVARELPEMRRVSDEWLATKHVREKGFSLGFFDEAYLRRFPMALVRGPSGRLLAFANLWTGASGHELSVDLMRYANDAPKGVMDFLFVQLLLWGKANGHRWFDLGMAPLAGLEARELAPVWARAGAWLYRHGEHFYNYQGLRQYKDKFDPIWEPRYLASPGGLALPRILTNVAALISGGLAGAVRR